MLQRAIAYYRVSTQRQGRSGLGIEAQRAAVERFAASEDISLIEEFIEVETGKGAEPSTGALASPKRSPWPDVHAAPSSSPNSTGSRATLRSSPA